MSLVIYHNPRCSKSRATLALIREQGLEPEVVEYLKVPLKIEEVKKILDGLGIEPLELMRKKETLYSELNLSDTSFSREELIKVILNHPILMERPIVKNGDKYVLGRPPEKVLDIL